jgi:3-hydroxyisobutyrate dehydrogenase-like beta-hydroxyacid dehydrogenase
MTHITMIGCGEVGLAYAEALLKLSPAPQLQLFDPRPPPAATAFADRVGLPIAATPGPWVGSSDLVLVCTPGTVLQLVLDSLGPFLSAGTVVADMSTAGADAKKTANAFCAERGVPYVDIAITGSVALGQAKTPLLYAGPQPAVLTGVLQQLGAPVTVLAGAEPGDAIRVKLLRSVIMKGLEALAVECLPAAEQYGVLDQVWVSLGDVDRTGFVNLLQAMTRTHAQHAVRRSHEVAEAADQLDAVGLPSMMTRATEHRFTSTTALTAAGSQPADDSTDAAIEWLRTAQAAALV